MVLVQSMLLAGRSLRFFTRNPQHVIAAFAFPLVLMFTQLAVLGELVAEVSGQPYVARIAPLVVLSTAAFGSAITAAAVYRDLHSGLLTRVRAMPVSPASLFGGRLFGDLLRILAVASLTTAVAFIPGFRFSAGLLAAVGFFGVVVLFGTLSTAVGILVGTFGRSEESVQAALSAPATLLFILSSGFVPLETFPGFLQPLVWANPLSSATQALIGLSHGGPVAVPLLVTLAWTAGVGILSVVLVARRYRELSRP
ncbi:ABC transporter permease [Salinactinospora qingdaonensis]|uniref:Transport permease protein n=1 Tax=Salinactinospora qingdaonensis TaxID=702744 RepID=A0ABP7FFC5_9ACTN